MAPSNPSGLDGLWTKVSNLASPRDCVTRASLSQLLSIAAVSPLPSQSRGGNGLNSNLSDCIIFKALVRCPRAPSSPWHTGTLGIPIFPNGWKSPPLYKEMLTPSICVKVVKLFSAFERCYRQRGKIWYSTTSSETQDQIIVLGEKLSILRYVCFVFYMIYLYIFLNFYSALFYNFLE